MVKAEMAYKFQIELCLIKYIDTMQILEKSTSSLVLYLIAPQKW
jgi:hypothetical protein